MCILHFPNYAELNNKFRAKINKIIHIKKFTIMKIPLLNSKILTKDEKIMYNITLSYYLLSKKYEILVESEDKETIEIINEYTTENSEEAYHTFYYNICKYMKVKIKKYNNLPPI